MYAGVVIQQSVQAEIEEYNTVVLGLQFNTKEGFRMI